MFGSLASPRPFVLALSPQPSIPSQPEFCSAQPPRSLVMPSSPIPFPLTGRVHIQHAFRSIRKTRPVDRRTVAHSHGLPLRGTSVAAVSSGLRGASWHMQRDPRRCVYMRVCARASRLARARPPSPLSLSLFLAMYNKLATRARIIPSYWK